MLKREEKREKPYDHIKIKERAKEEGETVQDYFESGGKYSVKERKKTATVTWYKNHQNTKKKEKKEKKYDSKQMYKEKKKEITKWKIKSIWFRKKKIKKKMRMNKR